MNFVIFIDLNTKIHIKQKLRLIYHLIANIYQNGSLSKALLYLTLSLVFNTDFSASTLCN